MSLNADVITKKLLTTLHTIRFISNPQEKHRVLHETIKPLVALANRAGCQCECNTHGDAGCRLAEHTCKVKGRRCQYCVLNATYQDATAPIQKK